MRETVDFDQLFRLYYKPLFRYALQYVDDEEDCHDIVSAAYEDVWRGRVQLESSTARSYLYTNVRNKCIDHLRRSGCHQRYVKYVERMSQTAATDRYDVERADTQSLVDSLLSRLGTPTREILEACYLQEKKYKEVAAEMGISVSTVKKHMVRALKTLRELKKSLKT